MQLGPVAILLFINPAILPFSKYNSEATVYSSVFCNFIGFKSLFFGIDFSLLHFCTAYRERRRD